MNYSAEYQKPTSGYPVCSYSKLKDVYGHQMAGQGVPVQNNYVVPLVCDGGKPSYNALSHGLPYQCGGYFNLKGAYPKADCKSCAMDNKTAFVQRPCSGNVDYSVCNGNGNGTPPPTQPPAVESYRYKRARNNKRVNRRGLW